MSLDARLETTDSVMLDDLISRAKSILPFSSRKIQAFSYVSYRTKFDTEISPLSLSFLNITAGGLGSCFYELDWKLSDAELKDLLGMDALLLDDWPDYVRIAALDASYGVLKDESGVVATLDGHPSRKARLRAKIIAREAEKQLFLSAEEKPFDFACVGVVGPIVEALGTISQKPLRLTENNRELIGKIVAGSIVQSGELTTDAIAASKVAVVTAMTFANGTFSTICKAARQHSTKIIVFAQSGANFAKAALDYGAHVVICEPFPFYNTTIGPSNIHCYRL